MSSQKTKKNNSKIGPKKRAIIISAALRVFSEYGFKGASIQKIADIAGVPKANVLYYFANKQALYSHVMQSILSMWNSSFDSVTKDDDPSEALANYIEDKMEISRVHPFSSKVFAIEIINGAHNLDEAFKTAHQAWVKDRVEVIQHWVDAKLIDNIDPEYLLYQIWSSTQHYADFSAQILQLRGKPMDKEAFVDATRTVIRINLKGLGLEIPERFQSK